MNPLHKISLLLAFFSTLQISLSFGRDLAGLPSLTLQAGSTYEIHRPIRLDADDNLRGPSSGTRPVIRPSSSFKADMPMLIPSEENRISNIVFDGSFKAQNIVRGHNVHDITLRNCVFKNTNNRGEGKDIGGSNGSSVLGSGSNFNYSVILFYGTPDSRGIDGENDRIRIEECTVTNAGFKTSGSNQGKHGDWNGHASGICLLSVDDVEVINTYVQYAVTAGIWFGGSRDVLIEGCEIYHTGLDRTHGSNEFTSDGVCAYKNYNESFWNYLNNRGDILDSDFVIRNNVIHHYKNHGIHVSGKDIDIYGNYMNFGSFTSIWIGGRGGDSVSSSDEDPLETIEIFGNTLIRGNDPANGRVDAFYIGDHSYSSGQNHFHSNSGHDSRNFLF